MARAICKASLLLHGADGIRIEVGDVLHSPKLTGRDGLIKYDRVISAPPFNRSNWGAEDAADDGFGRFPIVPPKHIADYAYILHCLSILEEGGRAVVLVGIGVLFRGGAEENIRRMLLERDHFEAVVGLPPGLLYGTNISSALIVLRNGKSPRSGKVLFLEVRRAHEKRARDEALSAEEIDAVVRCVERFEDIPDMARVVDVEEVARKQWGLSPAAYLPHPVHHTDINVAAQLEVIRRTEAERDEAASRADEILRDLAAQLDI